MNKEDIQKGEPRSWTAKYDEKLIKMLLHEIICHFKIFDFVFY